MAPTSFVKHASCGHTEMHPGTAVMYRHRFVPKQVARTAPYLSQGHSDNKNGHSRSEQGANQYSHDAVKMYLLCGMIWLEGFRTWEASSRWKFRLCYNRVTPELQLVVAPKLRSSPIGHLHCWHLLRTAKLRQLRIRKMLLAACWLRGSLESLSHTAAAQWRR